MFEKDEEYDKKREKEFDFFLAELKKYGDKGLRPHQAYLALCQGLEDVDKFYWEGVYGPSFDEEIDTASDD